MMNQTVMSLLSQARELEHKSTVLQELSELIQWDTAEALLQFHEKAFDNGIHKEANVTEMTERLGELLQPMLGQHGFDVAIRKETGKPLVTTIVAEQKKVSYLNLTFLHIDDLPVLVWLNPVLRTIELSKQIDPIVEQLLEKVRWHEKHQQPEQADKEREKVKNIRLLEVNLPALIGGLSSLRVKFSPTSFASFDHDESEVHS